MFLFEKRTAFALSVFLSLQANACFAQSPAAKPAGVKPAATQQAPAAAQQRAPGAAAPRTGSYSPWVTALPTQSRVTVKPGGAPIPGNQPPAGVTATAGTPAAGATAAKADGEAADEPVVAKSNISNQRAKLYYDKLYQRAVAFDRAGKYKDAEKYYRRAVSWALAPDKPDVGAVVRIYGALRDMCKKQNRTADAIAYAQRIPEATARAAGEHHLLVASQLKDVADMQFANKKYDDAKRTYQEACATASGASFAKYLGPTSTPAANLQAKIDLVTALYAGLANCFEKQDDPNAIDDDYKASIDASARIADKDIPKYDIQAMLLQRYRDYLSNSVWSSEAASLDTEIQDALRKQESNRYFPKGALSRAKI